MNALFMIQEDVCISSVCFLLICLLIKNIAGQVWALEVVNWYKHNNFIDIGSFLNNTNSRCLRSSFSTFLSIPVPFQLESVGPEFSITQAGTFLVKGAELAFQKVLPQPICLVKYRAFMNTKALRMKNKNYSTMLSDWSRKQRLKWNLRLFFTWIFNISVIYLPWYTAH